MTSGSESGDDDLFLRRLLAKVQALARRINRLDDEADDIKCVIDDKMRLRPTVSARHPPGATAAQETERTLARTEAVMAAEAARGASLIRTLPNPDGSAKVTIDGRIAELTPMLAYLFEALISDKDPSDDEFVEWKSEEQIRKMISKKSDKPLTSHALTNLVSRLRQALRDQANLHPKFIQRHAQRGLRFALRRQGFESGGGGNTSPNGKEF